MQLSNSVAKKCLYLLQAPNAASDPQQRIHRITSNFPDTPVSPFHENDPLRPLARLEIKRISPKPGQPLVCNGDDDEDYDVDECGKDYIILVHPVCHLRLVLIRIIS